MALELWALARVNSDWVKKYQMIMTKKENTMAIDHHPPGEGPRAYSVTQGGIFEIYYSLHPVP